MQRDTFPAEAKAKYLRAVERERAAAQLPPPPPPTHEDRGHDRDLPDRPDPGRHGVPKAA